MRLTYISRSHGRQKHRHGELSVELEYALKRDMR